MSAKLRFGAFVPPFYGLNEDPTLSMERDLDLVTLMDQLGYDEAWIGEHHSGGMELIPSPELFIAASSQRTKNIRYGTGVVSLPYHNPFMVAERLNFLDHITRGRVMMGMGPGSLPTDAHMMGVPIAQTRARMDEAMVAVVALLRGETVTMKTDWFDLNEARLVCDPYSRPSIDMAVASVASPGGAVASGRYGIGLISVAATQAAGFNALASTWALAEQAAAESGRSIDRSNWRVVGPMHIAETREQARAEVRYGIEEFVRYYKEVAALPIVPPGVDPVDAFVESKFAVIGTPDDAVEQITRLQEQSGGFGAYLLFDHNWAPWAAKKRSYEMIARYVRPHFQAVNGIRRDSWEWAANRREGMMKEVQHGIAARTAQHIAEKGEGNINPDILNALKAAEAAD